MGRRTEASGENAVRCFRPEVQLSHTAAVCASAAAAGGRPRVIPHTAAESVNVTLRRCVSIGHFFLESREKPFAGPTLMSEGSRFFLESGERKRREGKKKHKETFISFPSVDGGHYRKVF